MAVALVQALFVGQSKTAEASFAITGSKTITVGNTLFVGFAADTGGSAHSCTDNLGNTYTIVEEVSNPTNVRAVLFSAPVTIGGTLTTQTVAWTTNVTAKAAESAEFSGVGELSQVGGGNTSFAVNDFNRTLPVNGLFIGVGGLEQEAIPTLATSTGVPSISTLNTGTGANTTGGGTASNIGVRLGYGLGLSSEPVESGGLPITGTGDKAGAGGVYFPFTSPSSNATQEAADVTDDAGIGTVVWTSQTSGRVTNDNYTTNTLIAAQTSHYLKSLNFKFAIPAGKVVNGIKVFVEAKQALVLTQLLSVRLVKGGTVSGDTKTFEIPTTEAYLEFGGAADLWGLSLLDTDVEAATFGCVAWIANAAADTYSIDNVYIEVYWGTAAQERPYQPWMQRGPVLAQ